MADKQFIEEINTRLNIIAQINSFVNDGKNYYISSLGKEYNDISKTLQKHFNVHSWTFDLKAVATDWRETLKHELIWYFGQYILQAKQSFIQNEYRQKEGEDLNNFHKRIILDSGTNCEFILDSFINDINKIVKGNFTFYKLKVNWETPKGYEAWYECYENDYLFDLGEQILFLHFGGSD